MDDWRDWGHSINLVGLATACLASVAFNDHPRPLHLSGVREMNKSLFEMLGRAKDLHDAAEAFHCYMMAMFGIDPEQQEDGKNRISASTEVTVRHYRSSFLRLLKGWGYDSNGQEGAVLKGWVESRFGLYPTFHKVVLGRIGSPAWATYVEEKMSSRFHNNSILTQLDILFEFCQWALARFTAPETTHLRLYRGTNGFHEHPLVARLDRRTVIVRLNNLASFSADREVAECFGDTIISADVPVVKVAFFNTLLPLHPLKGEGEYLVVGGEYRVTAEYF